MSVSHQPRVKTSGVSLLEIMVVLAIMAMVVGLAAPRVIDSFSRAKAQAAEVKMANLNGALQMFYIDVGRYPSELEGLESLLRAPAGVNNWRGPYVTDESDLADPWDRTWLYRHPGQEKPFDLYTHGRDGQPGGSAEDSDIYL